MVTVMNRHAKTSIFSESKSTLENKLLHDFDVHLQKFYQIVIGKEIGFKYKSYAKDIKGILEEIVLSYKKEYSEKAAMDLRFLTRKRRCAYILKHSPLFTCTVAFHFSEMVKKNPTLMEKSFQRRRLNLCCLGGGPASEVVAITKVLGPLYSSTGCTEPLLIKVTIVDINEYWITTCGYVLEILKEDSSFEGVERITFDFDFVKADLSKPFTKEVNEAIEKADITTTVYFVSAVNGGKYTEESYQMVKKIMEVIKTESILFYLDNATDVHFQQMDRAAREMGDMEIIYEPCVESLRFLSLNSVEKFLEIYKGWFDAYSCMTYGFMSYCVWRKSHEMVETDEEEEGRRRRMLVSQKNNEELTVRMKRYKRELQGLMRKKEHFRKLDEPKNLKKEVEESDHADCPARPIGKQAIGKESKTNTFQNGAIQKNFNGNKNTDVVGKMLSQTGNSHELEMFTERNHNDDERELKAEESHNIEIRKENERDKDVFHNAVKHSVSYKSNDDHACIENSGGNVIESTENVLSNENHRTNELNLISSSDAENKETLVKKPSIYKTPLKKPNPRKSTVSPKNEGQGNPEIESPSSKAREETISKMPFKNTVLQKPRPLCRVEQ